MRREAGAPLCGDATRRVGQAADAFRWASAAGSKEAVAMRREAGAPLCGDATRRIGQAADAFRQASAAGSKEAVAMRFGAILPHGPVRPPR
jgi:hypothetical protein